MSEFSEFKDGRADNLAAWVTETQYAPPGGWLTPHPGTINGVDRWGLVGLVEQRDRYRAALSAIVNPDGVISGHRMQEIASAALESPAR